jgi:hypothetical protein
MEPLSPVAEQTEYTVAELAIKYSLKPSQVYYRLKSFSCEPCNGKRRNKKYLLSDVENIFDLTK